MTIAQTDERTPRKPLRLWPGVVAVVLLWLARFGLKAVVPGFRGFALGMMWALGAALAVVLWWLFFSRARWSERLGAIVLMIVGAGRRHGTSDTSRWGRCGSSATPSRACASPWSPGRWPAVASPTDLGARRWPRPSCSPAECGRSSGPMASAATTSRSSIGVGRRPPRNGSWPRPATSRRRARRLRPRRLPAAGERPQAGDSAGASRRSSRSAAAHPGRPPAAAKTTADWPGFRGPERDGIVRGVRIETDWSASPPVELWRRPIGPGWSSFAVRGDLLYTQEQRGDDEVVACYNVTTGEPVWTHRDAARFCESNARRRSARDADPQQRSRLHVRCDRNPERARRRQRRRRVVAQRGVRHRRRRSRTGASRARRWWSDDLVIVAAAGQLVAYDLATGEPRWFGPAGGVSYSSPHLVTIDGVAQVLLLSGSRRDQRRAGRRQAALGAPVAGLPHRAAGPDRGRRRPDRRQRRQRHRAASRSRTDPADGPSKSAGRRPG